MLTDNEIACAGSYVEELRQLVHELDVPGNSRVRAAGSCFAIAQEHHHAIVRLVEWQLFAAAFSLIRSEFETYVRGEWLSRCASDPIIEAFLQGKEPPSISFLLSELEALDSFNEGVLSQLKKKTWKSMCEYTHTGGLHIQRWNTEEGIEANYSRDEVLKVVKFAAIIASLSVIGIARLKSDSGLALRALKAFKKQVDE